MTELYCLPGGQDRLVNESHLLFNLSFTLCLIVSENFQFSIYALMIDP